MEDLIKKYDTISLKNYTPTLLKSDLEKWKAALLEEIDIFNNKILDKYFKFLPNDLLTTIKECCHVAMTYIGFIEGYHFLLTEYKVNLSHPEQIFRIKYLRENYNKILLIIQKIFFSDKKFINLRKDLPINKREQFFYNKELTDKLLQDLQSIKDTQSTMKVHFNYKLNRIYPSDREIENLYSNFIDVANEENKKLDLRIKVCPRPDLREKYMNSKKNYKVNTKYRYKSTECFNHSKSSPYYFEMKKISDDMNECKELCQSIKENMDKYCTCLNQNSKKTFANIKTSTNRLTHETENTRDKIKQLNMGFNELTERINNFESKFLANIKENQDIINLIKTNSSLNS